VTTVFSLHNIQYRYARSKVVLDGLTLDFAGGERTAILGANGTGKSTLLSLLDGLIFHTSGTLSAFGRALSEEALEDRAFSMEFRKRVALVFSNPDVQLFSPTVWDDIAFGPLQLGLAPGKIKEIVEAQLESLRITDLRDRAPQTLSDGQKKKVAIASSLATDPDVLLLDEPTNGLDPRTQVWLIEILHDLHQKGKTIIVATHDLAIAGDIAERAVVFGEDHTIAADGPFREIINDEELLLKVNLIHEHAHFHGTKVHVHRHGHFGHVHQDGGAVRAEAHSHGGTTHAHPHPNPHEQNPAELDDRQKLAIMLDYWINHGDGHVESYQEWAGKAGAAGEPEVAREIRHAMDDSGSVKSHLLRAKAMLSHT
jgi:cobalt/nickel transport system ATP-binding protein